MSSLGALQRSVLGSLCHPHTPQRGSEAECQRSCWGCLCLRRAASPAHRPWAGGWGLCPAWGCFTRWVTGQQGTGLHPAEVGAAHAQLAPKHWAQLGWAGTGAAEPTPVHAVCLRTSSGFSGMWEEYHTGHFCQLMIELFTSYWKFG